VDAKKDFFISYTSVDSTWAEWIAYVLEEQGFSTILQAWDFRPGSNFVLEMQRAASVASRTIMVLSPEYLKSQFTAPEWAAAYGQDPQGLNRKVVPVQVRACHPTGLLAPIVQIRIDGLNEDEAHERLIAGIKETRTKPISRPAFPGVTTPVSHKSFPGSSDSPIVRSILPSLMNVPTDADKRRFVKQGFDQVKQLFEANLVAATKKEPRVETDFSPQTASDFRAELFVDGKSKSSCRIWQDGMHSKNNICYSSGHNLLQDGCNEILGLAVDGGLHFSAQMAMGSFKHEKSFNLKKLTAEEAAEYLWQRFISPLDN